jgi:hypothetical protein
LLLSVANICSRRNARRNEVEMARAYTERMITKAHTQTAGDAAVDGLLAGGAAGVGMAAYLLIAEWIGGMAALTVLGRFDPAGNGSPVAGVLAHLAVSAVYGAFFGGLRHLIPFRRSDWRLGLLCGLAYGLALLGLALGVLLPAASPLRAIAPVHFGVAHGVYGLIVGFMVNRSRN